MQFPWPGLAGEVRRVPAKPAQPTTIEKWKVGKFRANRCIETQAIAAAVVMDERTVDVVLRGGQRWRLKLSSECPQLGFYGGLYYKPTNAGQMCAGKDRIMGRAGSSCRVQSIASLSGGK